MLSKSNKFKAGLNLKILKVTIINTYRKAIVKTLGTKKSYKSTPNRM